MKAASTDRAQAIKIIFHSLENIPSTNWIVGPGGNKSKHYRSLAEFMVDVSIEKNGVYLSSCRKGVLLMFHSKAKANPFKVLYYQLKLIHNCIGYSRLFSILNREKHIQSIRLMENDYLYVWFYGVEQGFRGRGAAHELKDVLMNTSKRLNLPVLIETTLQQNKNVYERYGFSIYHAWMMQKSDFTTWFMRLPRIK